MNSEWRRWEEADKWHWDEVKRKRWAEGLWRAQHLRRLRKAELLALREAAAARQRCACWLHKKSSRLYMAVTFVRLQTKAAFRWLASCVRLF